MGIKTAINFFDGHIPFHSKACFDIMFSIAKDSPKPIDEWNIGGDFVDMYWMATHKQLPECYDIEETMEMEIEEARKMLGKIRRISPDAKIRFFEGNHCYRLQKYLMENARALFPYVNLKLLLGLKELGIEFIPYGKTQLRRVLDTGLFVRHEGFDNGKHCAVNSISKGMTSVSFGHTHRSLSARLKAADGREIEAHSCGWMGDCNHPVFSYIKNFDQWTNSFQIVTSYEGEFFVENIQIKNKMAAYNGHIYISNEEN